jgi:hypothetical protein
MTAPQALIHCSYALSNEKMITQASDNSESQPAAPRTAEEFVDYWVKLLGLFKADAELSGDLAGAMELLNFTPQLFKAYPLMKIARKEAALSLLCERISWLDGEIWNVNKQPIRKLIPKILEQEYYDQLISELSLEDDSMTERVLAGDISPPSPPPDKPLSNDEWMNRVVKNMNELDKSPRMVNFLSKRGF